ncbi:hypothetical protein ACFCP7_28655 [Paenibacillus elgii]
MTKINTDETSAKRGHNYITIFIDPEQKKLRILAKLNQLSSALDSNCAEELPLWK